MNVSHAIADMAQQYAKYQIKRKHSGLPAIVHPIQVLNHCVNSFKIFDNVLHLGCIYHDYLEDIPWASKLYLYDKVGSAVCDLVQEVTFNHDLSILASRSDQKAEYILSFLTKSPRSIVLKIADRIANTSDFMCDEESRSYAPKYWNKAKPLFDIFLNNRRNDIIDYCGKNSYDIIANQIELMSEFCG